MSDFGILREIKDDELELMLAWRNDPKVRANMYTRHTISLQEHISWWERTKHRADQRYYMFEYEGKATGIAAFSSIDTANGSSAWAYYAAPNAPKGSGSRMEFLMLDEAFNTLKLHKLYCEVLAFNTAVITLHQKFGFTVEGIFRQHYCLDTEYVDIYRLGILKDEWPLYRSAMFNKLASFAKEIK